MIRISHVLAQQVEQAIRSAQQAGDLPEFELPEVHISRPARPEHGDYAANIALQVQDAAGMKGKSRQIAEIVVKHLPPTDLLSGVEIAGPGFINFRLADTWLQQQVDHILEQRDSFAQMDDFAGKRAQVECVSANPTGPLHVGRIRGGVIGDTMARLLRAMGYTVEMEYYFNNAGRQMRLLGESLRARYLERLGMPAEFPGDGYRGEYLVTIADQLIEERGNILAEEDAETFQEYAERAIFMMIRGTLARLHMRFDHYFNENSLYEGGSVESTLDRLRDLDLVYEAMGPERDEGFQGSDAAEDAQAAATGPATWLRMRKLRNAPQDVALVKSTGEPTYRLPDIAYHLNKLERGFDLAINILGGDHLEEAKDVKAAMAGMGFDAERIQHIIHQFVMVQKEGAVKKGSTRAGDIIPVDDVLNDLAGQVGDRVAVDAVRYFFLVRAPNTEIVFDYDLATKHSNENPVYYIQNAHVRCAGIARQAAEQEITHEKGDVSLLSDPGELNLIRRLIELPDVIERAATDLEPHKIAYWAQELAGEFHPTYDEIRALHGDVPDNLAQARLKLYAAAKIVFARVLDLMGMSAPETM